LAFQHFYSRVPARVSMYNRADGFDTFALSAGLEREFVEREMTPVYENKLNKNDVTMVRRGEMPCVYTQCCTRSGVLVQNCVSYLSLDYTGERSAYLSHSLVYSSEEKQKILSSRDETTLNPDLFVTDITGFDLTAPDAVPDTDYPQIDYLPGAKEEGLLLTRDVNPETAKSFLYAILNALCGKGRNVYFKLPGEDAVLSRRAVQLYNELLAILPCQLRGGLSFASYVTDATMYPNHKLKGVSAHFPDNAAAKFVYFDLQTNLISGVQHDEVVANKALINFLYSLLENKGLREEFLSYMDRAAAAIPALQNLNLKVLNSLVFLFQCSSALYSEQEILPNDALIYDYLCAYEKYRAALNDEYRMQVYKCLLRYPRNHQAIPKNIFAKASRLYTGEAPAAKRIFMNIVLELIHTDIMRDKLFTFIRSNYQNEDADMKRIIVADLCRVFYGGFLQNQILAFFDQQFPEESEESRSAIIQKLLLSIRTQAVQPRILDFLDRHYDALNKDQKVLFYRTFLEMLPECDALAVSLLQTVNSLLQKEPDFFADRLDGDMTALLEADYRRKDHKLMPLLLSHAEFARDLVIRLSFGPWQGRKIREELMQLFTGQPLEQIADALAKAFALVPDLDQNRLISEISTLMDPEKRQESLFCWLEIAQRLSSLPEPFAGSIFDSVVLPAVCHRIPDAFDPNQGVKGMQTLRDFAADHREVSESPQFRLVELYSAMVSAARLLDFSAAAEALDGLLTFDSSVTARVASYMEYVASGEKAEDPKAAICLEVLQSILADRVVPMTKLYKKYAVPNAPQQTMLLLLSVWEPLAGNSTQILAAMRDAKALIEQFTSDYRKGAHHWLRVHLHHGGPLTDLFLEAAQSVKAPGSFLSRLFASKK